MAKRQDLRDYAGQNDVNDILSRLGVPPSTIQQALKVVPLTSSSNWRGIGYHWTDVVKVVEKELKQRIGTLEFDMEQHEKKVREAGEEIQRLGRIASSIPADFPA